MNSRYSILFKLATVTIVSAFAFTCSYHLVGAEKKAEKHKGPQEYKVDVSKLPKPLDKKVDYKKEVEPLLKKSCYDCHSEGSVFGEFRLDNQKDALKGGENGVMIIPGKSEKSPMIYFVAQLVPDMEMPPKGEGDPLTKEQISLLRAWIDQGAKWE